MSSCCRSDTVQKKAACPACEQLCFPINRQTILQQVQFPHNQSIAEGGYAFCSNRNCHSGYFSASTIIPKNNLRAFQANQTVMLCHCFDISESAYRAALKNGLAEAVKAFVIQQTKDGVCSCESRNPSGRCCLSNFRLMEKAHVY